MIIIDEPYVSAALLDWMEESQHPVLANDFAQRIASGQALPATLKDGVRATPSLNLISEEEAILRVNSGQRVYTCAEAALEWIDRNTSNETLKRGILACKDKALFRKLTKNTKGAVSFFEISLAQLLECSFEQLNAPCVIKPSVGFCSVGVHVVQTPEDWEQAKAQLTAEAQRAEGIHPKSVVNAETYVVEEMVVGHEMAVEAYFDAEGKAYLLNLFTHEFASADDTSDRLYLTSTQLIESEGPRFAAWLEEINSCLGLRDFCVHPEVRVAEDGTIRTIEFNPLRFAGMGGADCCFHAYGFKNYQVYLSGKPLGITAHGNVKEEMAELFGQARKGQFAMGYLGVPASISPERTFRTEAFCEKLPGLVAFYPFDPKVQNGYGFAFVQGEGANDPQFDHLLNANFQDYLD